MSRSEKKEQTENKPALNFNKVATGGEAVFHSFEKNPTFTGFFIRVLPENHHLNGIEFREYETNEIITLSTHIALVKYFSEIEPSDNEVFQITLAGSKELKGNKKVFLFDIFKAEI